MARYSFCGEITVIVCPHWLHLSPFCHSQYLLNNLGMRSTLHINFGHPWIMSHSIWSIGYGLRIKQFDKVTLIRLHSYSMNQTSSMVELIDRYKWDFPFTCFRRWRLSQYSLDKTDDVIVTKPQLIHTVCYIQEPIVWNAKYGVRFVYGRESKKLMVQLDGTSANFINEISEIELQFNFWLA